MGYIKKGRKPSARMLKAAKIFSENLRRKKPVSMGKVLEEAGYKKSIQDAPQNVTNSKTWLQLMEEFIPDDFLAKKHKQLSNSSKLDHYIFPLNMPDEEIRSIVESIEGCRLRKIVVGQTQKFAYYWIPDNKAQIAALDMGYKLKGKYAAQKVSITDEFSEMSDEELSKYATELEIKLKKLNGREKQTGTAAQKNK